MIYQFDDKKCLNGWWDFLPAYRESGTSKPPQNGWLKNAYLVPSWFKQYNSIYKKKGDKYYTDKRLRCCEIFESDKDEIEYFFNTMDYPDDWNCLNAAWAKRTINVSPKPGKRYFIITEGTSPLAKLFVNGDYSSGHEDPMLPMTADITRFLRHGDN